MGSPVDPSVRASGEGHRRWRVRDETRMVFLVYLVSLVCLVERDKPDEQNKPDKPDQSVSPVPRVSPATLQDGPPAVPPVRTIEISSCHTRRFTACQVKGGPRPHSLAASYCIQKQCAHFNRSDNWNFSCFAYFYFMMNAATSRRSRKRTTLGWKTRPTSPPLLALPGFRLLL